MVIMMITTMMAYDGYGDDDDYDEANFDNIDDGDKL
jgi:hypothetical protein